MLFVKLSKNFKITFLLKISTKKQTNFILRRLFNVFYLLPLFEWFGNRIYRIFTLIIVWIRDIFMFFIMIETCWVNNIFDFNFLSVNKNFFLLFFCFKKFKLIFLWWNQNFLIRTFYHFFFFDFINSQNLKEKYF